MNRNCLFPALSEQERDSAALARAESAARACPRGKAAWLDGELDVPRPVHAIERLTARQDDLEDILRAGTRGSR